MNKKQNFKYVFSVRTILLFLCIVFYGCASTAQKAQPDNTHQVQLERNETLLKAAENYSGLIDLYKEQLQLSATDAEADKIRIKVAETYLLAEDPESALFYIEPAIHEGRGSAELFLLKSRAKLSEGKKQEALQAAITAYGFNTDTPELFNQLGHVQASLGDYASARRNFEKARRRMMDDIVIQNNLAMLDILEGHFDSAAGRLMSLYKAGRVDNKVQSNLAIALAKSGRYQDFSTIFGNGKKEEEQIALFEVLAGTKAIVPSKKAE